MENLRKTACFKVTLQIENRYLLSDRTRNLHLLYLKGTIIITCLSYLVVYRLLLTDLYDDCLSSLG